MISRLRDRLAIAPLVGLLLVAAGCAPEAAYGAPEPQLSTPAPVVAYQPLSCSDTLNRVFLLTGFDRGPHDNVFMDDAKYASMAEELDLRFQELVENCANEYQVLLDFGAGKLNCADLFRGGVPAQVIHIMSEAELCPIVATPPSTPQQASPDYDEIDWDEAGNFIGYTKTVCGPLAGQGQSDDDAFLNLGLNYPDPGRFTIVIWDVGSVEQLPRGTTICTTGKITSYRGVPQIELRSVRDVLVFDN